MYCVYCFFWEFVANDTTQPKRPIVAADGRKLTARTALDGEEAVLAPWVGPAAAATGLSKYQVKRHHGAVI